MNARFTSLMRPTLSMIGTIIGAGIFAIPATFAKTGILTGSIAFIVIALLVMASHLLYVEVIARDSIRGRLPGHVGQILGAWPKKLAVITHTGQLVGAGLAYVILGGGFLAVIFSGLVSDVLLIWQVLFWFGGALSVVYGLRLIEKLETYLIWSLMTCIVLVVVLAIPDIRFARVFVPHWEMLFVPLGTFLFALSGLSFIAEIHEMTNKSVRKTRFAVALGSAVAAFLTWLFGVTAYFSLERHGVLPGGLIIPILGFLAVSTAFMNSAYDLQAMIRLDLKQSKWVAWGVALLSPLMLLFATKRDFVSTISVVGSLFTATNGLLVVVCAAVIMARAGKTRSHWAWRVAAPIVVGTLFLIPMMQLVLKIAVY